MIKVLIAALVLGMLWLALSQKARWRERARAAEKQNKRIRKAHALKNRIARDPDRRQRVRDHFSSP